MSTKLFGIRPSCCIAGWCQSSTSALALRSTVGSSNSEPMGMRSDADRVPATAPAHAAHRRELGLDDFVTSRRKVRRMPAPHGDSALVAPELALTLAR